MRQFSILSFRHNAQTAQRQQKSKNHLSFYSMYWGYSTLKVQEYINGFGLALDLQIRHSMRGENSFRNN